MRLRQLTWLSLWGIAFIVLALLWPGRGIAQEVVTVRLDPVGGSGVSGTAVLTAAGEGTNVELDVEGLPPGTSARAAMQANTCAMPSASFAAFPDLQVDASGKATATGSVLFRGTDNVPLATMADSAHIITIQAGQMVACGVIPALASASSPATLPGTGGTASWLMAATVVVLGLCALSAGLFLRLFVRSHRELSHTTDTCSTPGAGNENVFRRSAVSRRWSIHEGDKNGSKIG